MSDWLGVLAPVTPKRFRLVHLGHASFGWYWSRLQYGLLPKNFRSWFILETLPVWLSFVRWTGFQKHCQLFLFLLPLLRITVYCASCYHRGTRSCMDSRHHPDKTDNRFWFRHVRIRQKPTELDVTIYLRQHTSSHVAVAITEWQPLKLEAHYVYSPEIIVSSPLRSEWLVIWWRSHF